MIIINSVKWNKNGIKGDRKQEEGKVEKCRKDGGRRQLNDSLGYLLFTLTVGASTRANLRGFSHF